MTHKRQGTLHVCSYCGNPGPRPGKAHLFTQLPWKCNNMGRQGIHIYSYHGDLKNVCLCLYIILSQWSPSQHVNLNNVYVCVDIILQHQCLVTFMLLLWKPEECVCVLYFCSGARNQLGNLNIVCVCVCVCVCIYIYIYYAVVLVLSDHLHSYRGNLKNWYLHMCLYLCVYVCVCVIFLQWCHSQHGNLKNMDVYILQYQCLAILVCSFCGYLKNVCVCILYVCSGAWSYCRNPNNMYVCMHVYYTRVLVPVDPLR